MTDWARLFSRAANSGVYEVEEGADADFRAAAARAGLAVFELNLAGVKRKDDFLRAASRALKFPAYFGPNWDAFEECITDLSWLEAGGYAVLIYNPGAFRECDPAEMETARAVFEDAAGYWKDQDTRFFVGLAAGAPASVRGRNPRTRKSG